METKSYTLNIVKGFESYERNGDGVVFFKSKEAAENHTFFEIGFVSEVSLILTDEGVEEFNAGRPIW
jgi:hypothetical protein